MELQTYGFEPAAFAKRSASVPGAQQHVLPPLPHGYAALEPGIDAWMTTVPESQRHFAPASKLSGMPDPFNAPRGPARAVAAH